MKKLLSSLLAFVLVLSSSSVLAAKRTEENDASSKKRVNIAANCTFDEPLHEDCVGGIYTYWNTSVKWVEGGANGTKGCIKVTPGAWGHVYIKVPYKETIGETFDISFYGRIDKGALPMTTNILFDTPSGKQPSEPVPSNDYQWTEEWQKFEFTWTNTGAEPEVTVARLIDAWAGPGASPSPFYFDEFEVYPRGNIDYDGYFLGPLTSDKYPSDTGFDAPIEIVETDFPDMNGHWAENTVDVLAASSYVNGFLDGTYGPEKSVTRAEFVKMAMNVLRYEGTKYTGAFSDVTEDKWFANDVENANAAGLINKAMVKDGKFLPDTPITREEAAAIIAKVADIKAKENKKLSKSFTDEGSISDWAKDGVETAVAHGIINGYPNGSFGPDKNITRAEAASMLHRTIELGGRMEFYVDGENGDDENEGTKEAPFQTIQAARDAVQPLLSDMQNHIFVYIKGGDYHLDETVEFTTEDSGCNGYYVVYTSWGDEKPMFNMGEHYSGFTLHDKKNSIYKTYVGGGKMVGDVFVNDVRATMARTEYLSDTLVGIKSSLFDGAVAKSMLINPEKNDVEGWIICDNLDLLNYKRPQDLEFVFYQQWSSDTCPVETITKTEDGRVKIQFHAKNFYQITNSSAAKSTYPSYVQNALELVDSEGEWYYNKDDGYLYYKPRKFEDPKTMVASIPTGEIAFLVVGDSVDEKLHNIRFKNLGFEYTTCKWYLTDGNYFDCGDRAGGSEYVGNGRYTGYDPDAAFITCDVAYVDIIDCEFARTGGSGLTLRSVFQNCNVLGNHIYDIHGTALNIGHAGDEGDDHTRMVQPSDYKYYRCNNLVKNNLIHDFANQRFEAAHGLHISYVKNTVVTQNEIYAGNYMGIVVGGGLNGLFYAQSGIRGLEISNNYVHDTGTDGRNYDCGSIYFAGPSGGTEGNYNLVKNNYLENHRQNYGTLYLDTATRFYEITGNVTDLRDSPASVAETFVWAPSVRDNYIHGNWSTTSQTTFNQPDNKYTPATVVPDANWPAEAQAVVDNAGLTAEYLEKAPDNIQRIKLLSDDFYSLSKGDTVQLEVLGYKRKLNEQKLDYSEYNFFSSDDKVAQVDENGLITAVGSGSCHIFVEYLDGTIIRRKTVQIICDDKVIDITPPAANINVVYGNTAKLRALGITESYNSTELNPVSVHVEDESVATVSLDGTVTPIESGATKVKLTFEADGITCTHEVNLRVVRYHFDEETRKFLETSRKLEAGDPLFDPKNWVMHGGQKPALTETTETGGIIVKDADPSYMKIPITNEVISFDLTIASGSTSWPSVIWGASTMSATTSTTESTGDLYLFGWGSTLIELQKFKNAKHVAIFGYDNLNPVGGIGFPNKNSVGGEMGGELYNNEVTYSVTLGSIPVEDGERLILLMNGMPIYDFVDTDPVEGGKYFGIYNATSSFTLEPYTNQRFLGYED